MNNSRRLLRCASVPLLPAALAVVSEADAQVIYTPESDPALQIYSGNSSQIFFDLDHSTGTGPFAQVVASPDGQPAGTDFSLGFVGSGTGTVKTVNSNNGALGSQVAAAGGYATRFGFGDDISAASIFSSDESKLLIFDNVAAGNWADGDTAYVGLKLGDGYGWAELTVGNGGGIVLHDFAFNPDGAIAAGATGAVPEPATSALLAAALAGSVAVFQRRRQKKLAATESTN